MGNRSIPVNVDDDQEDSALQRGEVDLEGIMKTWRAAKNKFSFQVFQAFQEYRQARDRLALQRTWMIDQISATLPEVGKLLAEDPHYQLPDADNGIFERAGILFSYRPEQVTGDNADSGPVSTPSARVESPPRVKHEVGSMTSPKPTHRPNLNSRRRRPGKSMLPRSASHLPARDLRPRQLLQTQLPPIKAPSVDKQNYWVFEYGAPGQEKSLYIMRCPSPECQRPVFSKNPLFKNRAANHLRGCEQPYADREDMVRRYAKLVIPFSQGKKVTRAWARAHNSGLLARDELHLEVENLEAEDIEGPL